MMFADDIVLVEENLEEVNNRLVEWRLDLERKTLKISKNKMEYIDYDFGGTDQEVDGTERATIISGNVIGEVKDFTHLFKTFVKRDGGLCGGYKI